MATAAAASRVRAPPAACPCDPVPRSRAVLIRFFLCWPCRWLLPRRRSSARIAASGAPGSRCVLSLCLCLITGESFAIRWAQGCLMNKETGGLIPKGSSSKMSGSAARSRLDAVFF
jgi:hypothetical protein